MGRSEDGLRRRCTLDSLGEQEEKKRSRRLVWLASDKSKVQLVRKSRTKGIAFQVLHSEGLHDLHAPASPQSVESTASEFRRQISPRDAATVRARMADRAELYSEAKLV